MAAFPAAWGSFQTSACPGCPVGPFPLPLLAAQTKLISIVQGHDALPCLPARPPGISPPFWLGLSCGSSAHLNCARAERIVSPRLASPHQDIVVKSCTSRNPTARSQDKHIGPAPNVRPRRSSRPLASIWTFNKRTEIRAPSIGRRAPIC
ncbi:hypothetical protein KVR01_004541 [Diaporthe batatas]|uniref:uncharacterized protein n=1 Tax=Diaporthe batatas TaxID=748121 RepID=UPI001D0575FA|nr:uncharacterized protein KVR01_004541 [Diaporthe batatas]KAG8165989.1 hypothetical protein KVR01_004541 [Diaporthe batatas]